MPIASICIPVYNGEKYIRKTIESALAQTYRNFELLITDNASNDRTVDIIRSFEDERIRLIQNKENVGMAGNWNVCLQHATGKYIQVLCADDLLERTCLEKKVEMLESDEEINLVFGGSQIIDQVEHTILVRRPYKGDRIFEGKKFARKSFRSKNIYGEPSNVMFRKDASLKVGLYNEKLAYSPDWEYAIRLSIFGKVAYVDENLMSFRISTTSETNNLYKKKKIIQEDERLFTDSIVNISDLQIKALDILAHKISMNLRSLAKQVFLKLLNLTRKDHTS